MGTLELSYQPNTVSLIAVAGLCDDSGVLVTPAAYDVKFSLLDGAGNAQDLDGSAHTELAATYLSPGAFSYTPVATAFSVHGPLTARFRAYNGGSVLQAEAALRLIPQPIPVGSYRPDSINRIVTGALLGPGGVALSSPVVNLTLTSQPGGTVLQATTPMTAVGSNQWQTDVAAATWSVSRVRLTVQQYAGSTLQQTLVLDALGSN